MLQTLGITGPIYIVIAMGYLACRTELFSRADMRVLGRFVINFALPALVFTALSQRRIGEIVNGRFLFAYAVGSLAVMLGAFAWARWRLRKGVALSALWGAGMSSSNSGFIAYPVALSAVGPSAAVALAMCMVVENLVMIPLALAIAESGADARLKWTDVLLQSVLRLLKNPVIVAILAGLGVSLLEIDVSPPLARTVNLLALASTAPALFVIGGSLVGLNVAGMRRDVSTVAFGKLLLHPLAVGAMVWLLPPADPQLRAAAVVFASVPMMSIYPILAQKYHEEGFCAAALLVATVASFVTISVTLWVLREGIGWIGG